MTVWSRPRAPGAHPPSVPAPRTACGHPPFPLALPPAPRCRLAAEAPGVTMSKSFVQNGVLSTPARVDGAGGQIRRPVEASGTVRCRGASAPPGTQQRAEAAH